MIERLTPELRAAFAAAAAKWQSGERTGRIWEGDPTVWTGRDEAYWLGWLDAPEREVARLGDYAELAKVAARKLTDQVVCILRNATLAIIRQAGIDTDTQHMNPLCQSAP